MQDLPTNRPRRERPTLTWEEVRKRNSVERIKLEKAPIDILEDLPRLLEMPYQDVPENDILRLQWWGLYHDKPKVGNFMVRVKIPGGILTPDQLHTIGDLSVRRGRGYGEITTRQDIQLHWIELNAVPAILATLQAHSLTTAAACGDVVRNITGCPVAGIDAGELFDARPVVEQVAAFFHGNREYSDLPRKHKLTISACPHQCNAPEIHDVGLVGVIQDGQPGFAVTVGGGLSTFPRIARSLGVFVRPEEALAVVQGIVDIWRTDLNYRRSRATARFKFMVEDYGPDAIRGQVEAHLGRGLTPLQVQPEPAGRTDHLGVQPQKQAGLFYIGWPVFPGLLSGGQMLAVADIAGRWGADVRLTREQNLIITGVAGAHVDRVVAAMADAGLCLDVNPVRGRSIACTGATFCHYAVGETKPRLVRLVEHLEARFGGDVAGLRIYLDGCPHACGQHWVGDIGIQATSVRTETGRGAAYDVFLRGALGPNPRIGRPIGRQIPHDQLEVQVERLVAAYLAGRRSGETLQQFLAPRSDQEVLAILRGEHLAAAGGGSSTTGQQGGTGA